MLLSRRVAFLSLALLELFVSTFIIQDQNIKLVLGRFEENLSEMLFKLAVEVSKSNILSARNSDLNDYALNYLNAISEQLVAEHNGVLDLE